MAHYSRHVFRDTIAVPVLNASIRAPGDDTSGMGNLYKDIPTTNRRCILLETRGKSTWIYDCMDALIQQV